MKNYKTETEAVISSKWNATKSRAEYQEKAEVQSGATDRAQHQLVTAGCERFCERRKNRLLSTGLGTEMLSDFLTIFFTRCGTSVQWVLSLAMRSVYGTFSARWDYSLNPRGKSGMQPGVR